MKRLKTLCMIAASLLIFSACKKEKEDPGPSIVGFWKGKFGSGTSYPSSGYAFLFRGDGTVRVFGGNADTALAAKAEGTYTLSGSIVSTTYKYITIGSIYSTMATIDSRSTFQEGSWGAGNSTTNGGRYFLNKQ